MDKNKKSRCRFCGMKIRVRFLNRHERRDCPFSGAGRPAALRRAAAGGGAGLPTAMLMPDPNADAL
jgi:hypothetical protein